MIRKTLEAIAAQLRKEFGKNYEIWVEEQEQGLQEPCFFVQVINNSQTPKLIGNYKRNQTFDIIYFPKTRTTFELAEVAERLYSAMEYIEVNGVLVRGRKIHTEMVEDTLHFIVDYDLNLKEVKEKEDYMEELKQKGRLG